MKHERTQQGSRRGGGRPLARIAAWSGAGALALVAGQPALAQTAVPSVSRPIVQALPSAASRQLSVALARLGRDPRDVAALVDAGNAALDMDDVDAAIGFYKRAQQVSPNDARAMAGLAGATVRSGDPFAAIPLFDAAEKAGAQVSAIAADRGLAYDLVGDYVSAQRHYRLALARAPDDGVLQRLAISQAIGGDRRGAEATLLPLLQRQDKGAWRTRTFVLAIAGEAEEAVKTANTLLPQQLAESIAPYLRYMPRLTRAQQAAAANLGVFPRASEIGRDDPRVAQYAPPPSAAPPLATLEQGLVPRGAPLGSGRTSRAKPPRKGAAEPRGPVAATAAPLPSPPRTAPPEPAPARETVAEPPRPSVAIAAAPAAARSRAPARAAPAAASPAPAARAARPSTAPAAQAAPVPAAVAPAPAAPVLAIAAPATPAPAVVTAPPPVAAPVAVAPVAVAPAPVAPAPAAPNPVTPNPVAPPPGGQAAAGAPVAPPPAAPGPVVATTTPVAAPAPGPAVAPVPAPPARPPEPMPSRVSLAEAFSDLGKPAPLPVPAAGAVDIRRIKPASDRKAEDDKPAKPAPPSHPSRIWVQLGVGRNKAAMAFDWKRFVREAPEAFRGRKPSVSEAGQTNRLLAGPFPSERAAEDFLAQLRKAGVSGPHLWTSPAGQVVDALPGA